jgi:hypothetical protein
LVREPEGREWQDNPAWAFRFKPDPVSVSPFATPRHVAGNAWISVSIFHLPRHGGT